MGAPKLKPSSSAADLINAAIGATSGWFAATGSEDGYGYGNDDDDDDADRRGSEQAFQGFVGATSLKAEMRGRVPVINDAPSYREARKLLQELGGAAALFDELAFSGFVDPCSGMLTTNDKPYNVFAHCAAGKLRQPKGEKEQAALGPWQSQFMICCNRNEADAHWDSKDQRWAQEASMAKRHRFLTTKNLDWQWFNPIVFGMNNEEGGASSLEAAGEVQHMKEAALHYVRHVGGWSDEVGLFFH